MRMFIVTFLFLAISCCVFIWGLVNGADSEFLVSSGLVNATLAGWCSGALYGMESGGRG